MNMANSTMGEGNHRQLLFAVAGKMAAPYGVAIFLG